MNKVVLIGNLTKDVDFSTTASGLSVARFTLAVSRRYTNANGERETDFLPVVVWRDLADNCNKYLRKGNKCAVIGEVQTRSYDAQDGTKRYVTEIIANEVEFLTPKQDSAAEAPKAEAPKNDLEPIDDGGLPF